MCKIGVVIFLDFEMFDLFGLFQMFLMYCEEFEILIVGEICVQVKFLGGLKVVFDYFIVDLICYDVFLVSGGKGICFVCYNEFLMSWFNKVVVQVELVISVCMGLLLFVSVGILCG